MRPLETILGIPRVRLTQRVPLVETEKMVSIFLDRGPYRPMLVKRATEVTELSYRYFCDDEASLMSLRAAVNSKEFAVNLRTQMILSSLLTGMHQDGGRFKGFEERIEPLMDLSPILEHVARMADEKVDGVRERAEEIGELIGVRVPRDPLAAEGL